MSYFNSSKSFLQISERTDSHIENLHLSLTLWDGVLQLGAEVESWSANKLAAFAQSPSFQTEEDVRASQVKLHVSLCDTHVQIWSGPSHEKLNVLYIFTLNSDYFPLTVSRMRFRPKRRIWSVSTEEPLRFRCCFKAQSLLWSCRYSMRFSFAHTHNTFSFWCLATGGYGLLCEAQNHLNILSVVDQIE